MIEETLPTMVDVGVTYETYAAVLVPILIGAARALSHATDTTGIDLREWEDPRGDAAPTSQVQE
jgi:hypothetical protein